MPLLPKCGRFENDGYSHPPNFKLTSELSKRKRKFFFDKKLRLGKVHPMVWTDVNAHKVVILQLSRETVAWIT